ncbi:MAG: B-box zinc finger protein [Myxococcota bacterium]
MSAEVHQEPAPTCALHRDAPAAATCERCGAFTCSVCTRSLPPFEVLCPSCEARLGDGPHSNAWVALGLACFAFLVLPGVAALTVAEVERRRIEHGASAPAGLPWLKLARNVVLAQWALLFVGWLVLRPPG